MNMGSLPYGRKHPMRIFREVTVISSGNRVIRQTPLASSNEGHGRCDDIGPRVNFPLTGRST